MNFLCGNIGDLVKWRRKMKNNRGAVSVGLIALLAVFTVGYFVLANMFSYNFDVNFEEDLYDLKIAAIEKNAVIYAEGHEELFAESSDVYMTVEELALANVIISNSEGVVEDPRNSEDTLNDLRVKITNKDDVITAEVLA